MNAVIATTPAGMVDAQGKVAGWIDEKLADSQLTLREHEDTLNALRAAGQRTATTEKHIRRAKHMITFYEKVKAALAAGYYIIPPFNVQVFAIRTDREPDREYGSHTTPWRDGEPRSLPIAHGKFVNPVPEREYRTTVHSTKPGTTDIVSTDQYVNAGWQDIDLPTIAHKPELIERTMKAVGEKIFDALGIAPAYRAPDPIIVGQIINPKTKAPLTFFVAWWMDRDDL